MVAPELREGMVGDWGWMLFLDTITAERMMERNRMLCCADDCDDCDDWWAVCGWTDDGDG